MTKFFVVIVASLLPASPLFMLSFDAPPPPNQTH